MKTILVDPERCIQCGNCMIACKDEHCGNDWSPIAAAQGKGQQWVRLVKEEVCSGAFVKVNRTPVMCQHCKNAACVEACPHGAAYRREDGIVIIDPTKCTGCGACRKACAYGAIFIDEEARIAQKCTMCAHLLDEGWEAPRCVSACPADCLTFADVDELDDVNLKAPLEFLHPEACDEPLVAYVNLPKPFIAGEVASRATGELVRNAKVTVSHQVTGECAYEHTDCLGTFKAGKLYPGFYALEVEALGFEFKRIRNLDAREALNVGTIELNPLV